MLFDVYSLISLFFDSSSLYIHKFAGAFIVTLFYFFRFNSLAGTRSYTTANLYFLGLLAFLAPFVMIYFVFGMFLSPMVSTILGMALWLIPWLGSRWRDVCHIVAKIPVCAYNLRAVLLTAPFEMTANDQGAVQRKLAGRGYAVDDLTSAHSTVIQSRLLKAAAIVRHIESWEDRYSGFILSNWDQYKMILQNFDLISFKVARTIKQSDRVGSALGFAEAGSSAVEDWQALDSFVRSSRSAPDYGLRTVLQSTAAIILEDLRKELDFFIENILLFVSCGVLNNEIDFPRRRRVLQSMGFNIRDRTASIVPAVLLIVFIVSICTWLWLQAFGVTISGNKEVGSIKILMIGALNLLLNVTFIQFAKRKFAFANPNMMGKKPWMFIFTVGLIPTFIIALVRLLFENFQFASEVSGFVQLVERNLHSLPWSLNIWTTGTVIAFLSVDTTWGTISSVWIRRILDGTVLGLSWVAAFLLVFGSSFCFRIEGMPPGSLYAVMPTTFLFGVLIGFSIVSSMRDPLIGLVGGVNCARSLVSKTI